MERKVFYTLIHKKDSIGIKQVDGFKFSINNIELYGYVDDEVDTAYIIEPQTGRSVYNLPVFDDCKGINAIKYTVDSMMEDKHILKAFESKRRKPEHKLMKEIFNSFIHAAELEEKLRIS